MQPISKKKIAFLGTPAFTLEFLKLFKSLNLDIQLIVTSEDKPVGRGQQVRSPAPAIWAQENNIKFLQPKKLSEIENELNGFDLFIVIAYGKIIPEKIINLPKFGTINLHYSLLPKYRGASPVESAILNGEMETGITIQQMVYKLDAGNILQQVKMEILPDETTEELRNKLNQKALEIFPEFLNNYFSVDPRGSTSQNESLATICGKFSKDDFDVTEDLQKNNLDIIYKKYKAFDKKIYFFHTPTSPSPYSGMRATGPIRVKLTKMNSAEIFKLLPESKKEISLAEFERAYGPII